VLCIFEVMCFAYLYVRISAVNTSSKVNYRNEEELPKGYCLGGFKPLYSRVGYISASVAEAHHLLS
jgi:hypothetical protein